MKKQLSSIIITLLTATLVLSACSSAKSQNSPTDTAVVSTQAGKIRGSVTKSGVLSFKGVPYAQVTERFLPAKPVAKWEGVRDATEYGKISPQFAILGMGKNNAGEGTSNDCTNLNIWTPDADKKKRAVMVWLHGGGFSTGSANEAGYDGANLARSQNVVVVGVNHRLNVFGHLDLSSFGAKVLAMMTSPKAKGLFHKAINESGATEGMGVEFQRADFSRQLGELIVKKLGLNAETIDEIQKIDALRLMNVAGEAQAEIARKHEIPVSIGDGYVMEWEPVVDGDFLPTNPVLENGFAENGKNIPLLTGSNLNEWTLFMPIVSHPNMSKEARDEYKKAYPNEDEATAPLVDTLLRLPLLKITAHKADQKGAAVYSYIFTKQIGSQGAYHGTEIPFVFANTDDPLASVVSEAWANFAKTGNPSTAALGTWEAYTRESGAVMILDEESYLSHHHDEGLLKLLAPEYEW